MRQADFVKIIDNLMMQLLQSIVQNVGQTAIISVHIIAARIRELLRYFVIRDIFLIMKLVIVFII